MNCEIHIGTVAFIVNKSTVLVKADLINDLNFTVHKAKTHRVVPPSLVQLEFLTQGQPLGVKVPWLGWKVAKTLQRFWGL